MASMCVIGRAMFPPVTAKKVCREAKSRTRFFRVSKHRLIWRESLARLSLTRIWPLFSEVAPAFQRLARNAGCRPPVTKILALETCWSVLPKVAGGSRLNSAAFYRVPDNYGNTNGLAIANCDI